MQKIVPFLLFFFFLNAARAARVDTVSTYSPSMQKQIKAVVVTPDNYKTMGELPVVYLLHGFGGNYSDWIAKASRFQKAADQYGLIIVCPDGNNSWYWDSPVDPSYKYETYVSLELVKWVDGNYRTIRNRSGRAITGLSMGGHGALYLAFRHQDVFGAAGSMSGGVDIRPFPRYWEMEKRLGSYAQNPALWEQHTVINMLHLLTPQSLSLIIDCGTEDFFYTVNQNLHEKLQERNIPHDYITRPGAHNWPYWNNAVGYQLLFFSRFFNKTGW
ncbi:alpha/beta hydrolase family protein [Paraflavisolibacter sp. H34]|uniref:alpha/beta hydrolase n=1 Tax=Huijunlia imazamoxiresistens TaxID=3127457 RepID=UPI003018D95E